MNDSKEEKKERKMSFLVNKEARKQTSVNFSADKGDKEAETTK